MKTKRRVSTVGKLLGCALLLFVALFPIYWLVAMAIRPTDEMMGHISVIPQSLTFEHFIKMLIEDGKDDIEPSQIWSDDLWFLDQEKREFEANEGYWNIHNGVAEGTIIGGNLGTYNLLLGTSFRPKFEKDTVLFIEDTEGSSLADFERNLQALIYQDDFVNVKGIVIGRFQKGSKVTREGLEFILNTKEELKNLPILANVDFGHSAPLLTIPVLFILSCPKESRNVISV